MKNKWILAVCLFACAAGAAEPDRKLYQKIWPSVVRVYAALNQGRMATGSGIVVAADKVISNCHVTRDALAIDIIAWNQKWKVKEQAKDIDHDLCLLTVTREIGKPIEFGDSNGIGVGKEVVAAGYPGGGRLEVTDGQIRGLHNMDGARVIQTSAPFDSGESGGGLFDRDGKLLGVITFKLPVGGSFFFAVPATWVQNLMQARAMEFEGTKKTDAFWERLPANQPPFLRAIAHESAEDWNGLYLFADQWAKEDATNPETWIALGKSLYQMSRHNDAIQALKKATELEPNHAQAWAYLTRSYQRSGDNAAYAAALEKLSSLDVITAKMIGSEGRK
jgi:serine protease Do